MKCKAILFLAVFVFMNSLAISQQYRYFKDLDYSTMNGITPLNENALPNFYLKFEYDKSGNLARIGVVTKMSWEAYHSTAYMNVTIQNGSQYLFLGSGKQRSGYTRALFQKKVFSSDSAMIAHDTVIYKTTTAQYIRIQCFTGIHNDSIHFKEITIPFKSKKDLQASPLSSYAFYKDWFNMDAAAELVVEGIIRFNQDTIMAWHIVKGSSYRINITKKDFKDMPDMPMSLFWLKSSGLLY